VNRDARFFLGLFTSLLCGAFVAGCTANDVTSDLRIYVAEVKSRPKAPLEPLPEIPQVDTFVYVHGDRRDPFAPTESTTEESVDVGNGIAPDPYRRKEELEVFSLDTLRMVGTLEKEGNLWGLVTSADGILHRVRAGNYMGKNHGQITEITDTDIQLTEIISNGQGGYLERHASIALTE